MGEVTITTGEFRELRREVAMIAWAEHMGVKVPA
jgi:hypothetical protein